MSERAIVVPEFGGMVIRLCSAWNDFNKVTCDLPADHEGAHKATVYWENDDES